MLVFASSEEDSSMDQIIGMQQAEAAAESRDSVAQLLHTTQQGRQKLEIQETEDQHRLTRINAS